MGIPDHLCWAVSILGIKKQNGPQKSDQKSEHYHVKISLNGKQNPLSTIYIYIVFLSPNVLLGQVGITLPADGTNSVAFGFSIEMDGQRKIALVPEWVEWKWSGASWPQEELSKNAGKKPEQVSPRNEILWTRWRPKCQRLDDPGPPVAFETVDLAVKSWHRVLLQQPVAAAIKEGIHQPHHEELPRARFFPLKVSPISSISHISHIYIYISLYFPTRFPCISHMTFQKSPIINRGALQWSPLPERAARSPLHHQALDLARPGSSQTDRKSVTRRYFIPFLTGDWCAYLIHVLSFGGWQYGSIWKMFQLYVYDYMEDVSRIFKEASSQKLKPKSEHLDGLHRSFPASLLPYHGGSPPSHCQAPAGSTAKWLIETSRNARHKESP